MAISLKVPLKKTVVLILASALALFLIFQTSVNLESFSRVLGEVRMGYFWLAFATIPPTILLSGVRWYWMLRAAGFHPSLKRVIAIVGSGISLSVVPGRLGDLARSYPLRNEIPMPQAIGTIVVEKVVDISVLLGYSAIGFLILGNPLVGLMLLVLAGGAVPMLWFLHALGIWFRIPQKGFFLKIHEAFSILKNIKSRKTYFFFAYVSSCANWGLSMAQMYWLYRAVSASVPLVNIIAWVPVSMFIGLIPVTLAGIGTRDAALIRFFSGVALSSQSLAVGILYSLQTYFVPALAGLPFLGFFFKDEVSS